MVFKETWLTTEWKYLHFIFNYISFISFFIQPLLQGVQSGWAGSPLLHLSSQPSHEVGRAWEQINSPRVPSWMGREINSNTQMVCSSARTEESFYTVVFESDYTKFISRYIHRSRQHQRRSYTYPTELIQTWKVKSSAPWLVPLQWLNYAALCISNS